MENNINVEEIIREIRDEIKKRGYTDEMLGFSEITYSSEAETVYNISTCKEIVCNLNCNWNVEWYREIPGNNFIRFLKKVIRKSCAFLIRPMSEQQVFFNANVTNGFNQLMAYIEDLENQKSTYEEEIKSLEEKIVKLENTIKQMKA